MGWVEYLFIFFTILAVGTMTMSAFWIGFKAGKGGPIIEKDFDLKPQPLSDDYDIEVVNEE